MQVENTLTKDKGFIYQGPLDRSDIDSGKCEPIVKSPTSTRLVFQQGELVPFLDTDLKMIPF